VQQKTEKIRKDYLKAASFALILGVLASALPASAGSTKDIVDTAVAAGTFNTLATAVRGR